MESEKRLTEVYHLPTGSYFSDYSFRFAAQSFPDPPPESGLHFARFSVGGQSVSTMNEMMDCEGLVLSQNGEPFPYDEFESMHHDFIYRCEAMNGGNNMTREENLKTLEDVEKFGNQGYEELLIESQLEYKETNCAH